jgi:hypothetical protein
VPTRCRERAKRRVYVDPDVDVARGQVSERADALAAGRADARANTGEEQAYASRSPAPNV